MNNKNMTTVTELFFLGFHGLGKLKTLVFVPVLLSYAITVLLDIVIIFVSTRKFLHSPMYFFLTNFLFSEMLFVTLIVPNMLRIIWQDGASFYVSGCIIQSYLCGSVGSCESYLLAAMSYDRFLAICRPLHYNKMMDLMHQYSLVVLCWIISFIFPSVPIGFVAEVKFCGQNPIDHFFCDLAPFVDRACSDTSALQIAIYFASFFIIVIPFVLIIVSYASIFVIIIRMPSIVGRKKAFSTCSSHLSVVGIYYGTLSMNFFVPVRGHSVATNKVISVIFIIVTPFFSPVIYCLRNLDMRAAIRSYIHWHI